MTAPTPAVMAERPGRDLRRQLEAALRDKRRAEGEAAVWMAVAASAGAALPSDEMVSEAVERLAVLDRTVEVLATTGVDVQDARAVLGDRMVLAGQALQMTLAAWRRAGRLPVDPPGAVVQLPARPALAEAVSSR